MRAVSKELALGQIRAALRPSLIDPVEVRQVLLVTLSLGFDPSELYLQAIAERPEAYEKPPPLTKVLPPSVIQYLVDRENERDLVEQESEEDESEPEE